MKGDNDAEILIEINNKINDLALKINTITVKNSFIATEIKKTIHSITDRLKNIESKIIVVNNSLNNFGKINIVGMLKKHPKIIIVAMVLLFLPSPAHFIEHILKFKIMKF